VLSNLLSNAFKFTHEGSVTLRLARAADGRVAFAVADTGVGIPGDKLRLIFEAFQQGEGGTSRKYGGTGLGLSISREIARLLGGELTVKSEPGEGSEFTLYLPLEYVPVEPDPVAPAEPSFGELEPLEPEMDGKPNGGGPAGSAAPALERALAPAEVDDDRAAVTPGDRVLLVVCADAGRAAEAVAAARERGFKGLAAPRAEAGIALAHEFVPDAILLVGDGDDDGSALAHLKRHPQTRHIPVYVEADPARRQMLLRAGAAGHMERPASREGFDTALGELEGLVERRVKSLLVVEDDERQRASIAELVGGGEDVLVSGVGSSEEALAELEKAPFDCMVLDLGLPDLQGFGLLEEIKQDERLRDLPVIVYTGKELTGDEEDDLRRYAEAVIIKDGSSPERLLDETSLYLHRPEARLPQDKRRMLEQLRSADSVFEGRKILLVDDDVRNVFALASVLESHGMEILFAENGKAGIETLRENPDVDLVLMDIMMPEMDGYEATRRIRGMEEFRQLPIVALTAKAMKGDREKSLMAGASDYVAKPVDTDRLLSLMRVWLHG
jgi:CheY-like chemotaxis protein